MERNCDRCGQAMVLRKHEQDESTDGASSQVSSATTWDCDCGRTIMEFSASAGVTAQAEQADER